MLIHFILAICSSSIGNEHLTYLTRIVKYIPNSTQWAAQGYMKLKFSWKVQSQTSSIGDRHLRLVLVPHILFQNKQLFSSGNTAFKSSGPACLILLETCFTHVEAPPKHLLSLLKVSMYISPTTIYLQG